MTSLRTYRQCSIAECRTRHFCKGFCRRHYEAWKRHGDPLVNLKPLAPRGAPRAWLEAHVGHQGDECLVWPFARFPDGRAHMAGDKPARVMCAFVHGPAPSQFHEAAHSCGQGHAGCVSPRHLRWATPKENAADKELHGTVRKGEQHYAAKLTAEDVSAIRALSGRYEQKEIARVFGLAEGHVSRIVNRQAWRTTP